MKHLRSIFVALTLCTLLLSIAAFRQAPGAHAASDTSHCAPTKTSSYQIFCVAPTMTTYCSGQQYFPATDGYGNPLDWTYTDANNTCVRVSYNIPHSFNSCSVEMYIPNANSSATFAYNFENNGLWGSNVFNENPVDGWQPLPAGLGSNPQYIEFFDHQTQGGVRLGWGSAWYDGLRVTCG